MTDDMKADTSGSERISKDDVFIKRDENDELLPVEQEVPMLGGTAEVVPMPYGKVEKHFSGLSENDQIDSEVVAAILQEHVRDPDLSGMSTEDMQYSMKPMAPQALLMCVLHASGVEGDLSQNADGDAEIDLDLGNQS